MGVDYSDKRPEITNFGWQLDSIADRKENRFLSAQNLDISLKFDNAMIYFIGCREFAGTCAFPSDSVLQINWDLVRDEECGLADRQVIWYVKHRMKQLSYAIDGNSLNAVDQSGVRYLFHKLP